MPQIVIIADDLTGAADTGVAFTRAGLLTVVGVAPLFAPERPRSAPASRPQADMQYPECDALALSTQSRELPREEAVARVRQVCRGILAQGPIWIYKKMDSTLRGHPAAELAAVMDALKMDHALVAPAFPAQGRTTVGGRQLVNGQPIEQTSFGRDVPCSDLVELFRKAAGGWDVRLLELASIRQASTACTQAMPRGIVVADAETDADLSILALTAWSCGVRLFCGSAGLAHALVRALPLRPECPVPASPPRPRGPVLVVAGSRHPSAVRQVEFAMHEGAVVVRPDQASLGSDDAALAGVVSEVADHLEAGQDVILTTIGIADCPSGRQAVAGRLAQMVRRLVTRAGYPIVNCGLRIADCKGVELSISGAIRNPQSAVRNKKAALRGLVLTGGDIAAQVCAALAVPAICLREEVQPGMPFGILLGGIIPGLGLVTKAGGFGGDDALSAAITYLKSDGQLV